MDSFFLAIAAAFALGMMAFVQFLAFSPCPTEDSTWCVWNAEIEGNGRGRSFIALGNMIIYLEPGK